MINKPVPSPFLNQDFVGEVMALARKHTLHQVFIAFSVEDGDEDVWSATSNVISEGMIEYLEQCVENINENLQSNDNQY